MIVTGASSGIGRAASYRLASAGYRVYGLARSYDKLQEMAGELANFFFVPVEFDVTKPDKFDRVLDPIIKSGVFGLVNNAGYVEPGAIEDLSMESVRAQFETNFFGLVGVTKKILPALIAQKEGRIVNVSSMAGMVSLPTIGMYCATKHALEAFTEALRMELWNTGIKVASINPGVIETNIHFVTDEKVSQLKNSRFARAYKKYLQETPRGLPASIVADAIYDAVSSPKPKYRYLLGSAREKAGVRLRRIAPDDTIHALVAKRVLG
ncbi:SDR family oxidoreductase [Nitrososphaera viennensis]|uniref:SDR family oxidoreductase n=1 Tax=Nitrososphaera viennensis TaxID=1034015 RepID=A0A977NN52_9ARCH|nr:SDR family oxidoreductase [Nitrososphaera viennensis]UVS70624.1 SDR family oxidoreductase [Nitrososphaera viennensis]